MTASIVRALALGCVGVALSGCITDPATQSAIGAGLANPASITPANAAAAGVPEPLIAKAEALKPQIIKIASTACKVAPDVESILTIAAALSGNGTASSAVLTANNIAGYFCKAINAGTAYTAGTAPERPAKKVPAKPAQPAGPEVGDQVTGTTIINGQPVVVTGTKVR